MAKFRPLMFAADVFQSIFHVVGVWHRAKPDGITKEEARTIGYAAVDEALDDAETAGHEFAPEPRDTPPEPDPDERVAKVLARADLIRPSILDRLKRGKPAPQPES